MEELKTKPDIRFAGFTDAWEQRKLGEILKYEQPQPYIVESTIYSNDFDTPVLTAGQSFILGYTNETHGIKKADKNSPVIIFDDFTTSSHIVDFPFKVKSSAMKLLTLRNEYDDFTFALNSLKNIDYTPQSHERHWISKFSAFDILVPNEGEQKMIGKFFAQVDHLITLHQRELGHLQEQKKGLLQKMFPKDGADVPEVRFPEFTDAWEQRKVNELFKVTRGYVLAAPETSEKKTTEYPFPVYSSQTKNDGLLGYYNSYLYSDAITWTTDGANAGTVRHRNEMFYCTNVCGVLLSNEGYANKMVAEALNQIAWRFVSHVGNPKLMNNVMSEILVTLPVNLDEQAKISELFAQIDHLITLHQRKLEHLKEQKKALLQQMFI